MVLLPNTKSCFVCGSQNPIGMHQKFHTDGLEVHSPFFPQKDHAGFTAVVHGGITATLLDEIMVWACAVQTSSFAYCAEMTVRYQKPVLPGGSYLAKSRLDQNKKNRIFAASAEVVDESGAVYASATGKYVPIPFEEALKLFDDFEGEASEVKKMIDHLRSGTLGRAV
jgi:uncharacterized protein (TIGR00369 family)